MQGKIIKGIAGFYYIHIADMGVYECKAKGIFRSRGIKPLVGDDAEILILDEAKKLGNMVQINKRKNQLVRPAVSNVDQALVIFAAAKPEPNLNLLDRFLVSMEKQDVETIVCFNKTDIVSEKEIKSLKQTYEKCGYQVVFTSVLKEQGIEKIRNLLKNKTTVLAGPSGVGKSSLINELFPEAGMETGSISKKIDRGRHTTRHSELFCLGGRTYLMDTPGFSSLCIEDMEKEALREYFHEFRELEENCRFRGCVHIGEPDCAVKKAVNEGKLSRIRYENYVCIYEELKANKRY